MTTATTTAAAAAVNSEIRFCDDIGMFVWDRPRSASCVHRTAFCNAHCYNGKLERIFKLAPKDARNEIWWKQVTGSQVKKTLDRKRKETSRVRGCTRGENFKDNSDIDRIKDIAQANPERTFWLPTRAWRNPELRQRIQSELFGLPNVRIQASLDPSNSRQEVNQLILDGWSTMFFGNDDRAPIANSVKCQKTWDHVKGACRTCETGCFRNEQTHIWLKQH
jgi:hypothetical protein